MGFSHFHGRFSNPSPFKGEVRRGMGYICRCSTNIVLVVIHTFDQENADDFRIRMISARKATKKGMMQYEGDKP